MANVKIVDKNLVIEAVNSFEDFKKAERFSPKSLVLLDDDKKEEFVVKTGIQSALSKFGVSFSRNGFSNDNERATISLELPEEAKNDPMQYVAENYGVVIANLEKVESKVGEALKTIDQEIEATKSKIKMA